MLHNLFILPPATHNIGGHILRVPLNPSALANISNAFSVSNIFILRPTVQFTTAHRIWTIHIQVK